ncbi:MAG: hypothetical protein QOD86_1586 [Miltoncostaeaceae bacterium]|nr:hypothetical protein [Miltoncostaeaceae bacterium]
MTSRRLTPTATRRLALGVLALNVALGIGAVTLALAAEIGPKEGDPGAGGGVGTLMLPGIAFTVVGSLIAIRRPGHRVGWLCLAVGAMWMVVISTSAYGAWSVASGRSDELAQWVTWVGWLWVPAVGVMGTHLPLRLPDGRLPSPGWRPFSRFCTVAIVLVTVLIALAPSEGGPDWPENPIAVDLPAAFGLVFVLLAAGLVGAVASVVSRYRRTADARARVQIRWIALGAASFAATYIVTLLVGFAVADDSALGDALVAIAEVGYTAVPVAIGVAILRHRLYGIDRIINRALVYGSATALLLGAYVVLVLGLEAVLEPLTEGSGLAVALSTLAAAALFRPVRRQVQSGVDRRFYRRKYDAARTLERFAVRLRAETDLDAMRDELTALVRETVQPAHVSLWLREGSR